MSKPIKFLKRLVETPSPTGSETKVADLVRERLSSIADEIQTDTMGSVHAILKGTVELAEEQEAAAALNSSDTSATANSDSRYKNDYAYSDNYSYPEIELSERYMYSRSAAPTLMLSAHMDEVGLMVTYISDDGFLSVSAVGGVDAAILPGMRVDVHTADGALRGVVGRKPIHLIEPDERKNVTSLDKLVIDLGMPADKVKKKVKVGDQITYGVGFERLGKKMAVSKSFDDKSGVYVACRVMEELAADVRPESTFIAAITVQEEIGTRGAITSAHSVNPDVAIAFDVTHATDYPGIDKTKYGSIVCGAGPVIARGPNINPLVFDRLVAAAEAEGISYQLEAEPSVTGTDARSIQVAQGGIPTGLVSIPLRYMHTPTEMIDLDDLDGAIRLIARFARDLGGDASFIPGISPAVEHPDVDNIPQKPKSDKERIDELKQKIKNLNKRIAVMEAKNSGFSEGDRASEGISEGSEPAVLNATALGPSSAFEGQPFSQGPSSQSPTFKKSSFISTDPMISPQTFSGFAAPTTNAVDTAAVSQESVQTDSVIQETTLPSLDDFSSIDFGTIDGVDTAGE